MQAINDYVFVELDPEVTMSPGGIVLPAGVKSEFKTGVVVSIGEKVTNLQLKQRVLFRAYLTQKLEQNGKEVVILKNEEVLGIIE